MARNDKTKRMRKRQPQAKAAKTRQLTILAYKLVEVSSKDGRTVYELAAKSGQYKQRTSKNTHFSSLPRTITNGLKVDEDAIFYDLKKEGLEQDPKKAHRFICNRGLQRARVQPAQRGEQHENGAQSESDEENQAPNVQYTHDLEDEDGSNSNATDTDPTDSDMADSDGGSSSESDSDSEASESDSESEVDGPYAGIPLREVATAAEEWTKRKVSCFCRAE
jgi:hypothetical protein